MATLLVMSDPLDALEAAWRRDKTAAASDAYLAALEARVREEPHDARLRLRLGRTLFELSAFDRAIAALEIAKRDPALRPDAAFHLGFCYVKQRQARRAVVELSSALAHAPTPLTGEWITVAYLLAQIAETLGKPGAALHLYRMIREANESTDSEDGEEDEPPDVTSFT